MERDIKETSFEESNTDCELEDKGKQPKIQQCEFFM